MDKFNMLGLSLPVNSDISALGFLANIYYDFKNTSPFTPYIGGGIGFATIYVSQGTSNLNLLWFEDDDTVFAYQLGAGVGYDVSKNWTIDLGYRYFGTSDPQFGNQFKADFGSHNVSLGARYRF
jgi:opacity protein-like surface antigen